MSSILALTLLGVSFLAPTLAMVTVPPERPVPKSSIGTWSSVECQGLLVVGGGLGIWRAPESGERVQLEVLAIGCSVRYTVYDSTVQCRIEEVRECEKNALVSIEVPAGESRRVDFVLPEESSLTFLIRTTDEVSPPVFVGIQVVNDGHPNPSAPRTALLLYIGGVLAAAGAAILLAGVLRLLIIGGVTATGLAWWLLAVLRMEPSLLLPADIAGVPLLVIPAVALLVTGMHLPILAILGPGGVVSKASLPIASYFGTGSAALWLLDQSVTFSLLVWPYAVLFREVNGTLAYGPIAFAFVGSGLALTVGAAILPGFLRLWMNRLV